MAGNIITFAIDMKKAPKLWTSLKRWRIKHLTERQFTIILSLMVGICSGFAAIILKNLIHLASIILTKNFESPNESYQYLVYPGIGIFITVLFINFFVKTDINHGISKVLESISRNKSLLKAHNMFTSMISSTITI
jgi:CIC family chloride channel protein